MNIAATCPTYDGNLFTWQGSRGAVEISDLRAYGCNPGNVLPRPYVVFGRVWDDACDVGFLVRSPRTGAVRLFVFDRQELDAQGEEIVADHFVSHPDREFSVIVFND